MNKLTITLAFIIVAANLLYSGSRDTLTIKNKEIKIRALKLDEPISIDGTLIKHDSSYV